MLHEIVGSTDAQTIVPALEQLKQLIGSEGLDQYVYAWLDQHGVKLVTTVTDGDLTISLT